MFTAAAMSQPSGTEPPKLTGEIQRVQMAVRGCDHVEIQNATAASREFLGITFDGDDSHADKREARRRLVEYGGLDTTGLGLWRNCGG